MKEWSELSWLSIKQIRGFCDDDNGCFGFINARILLTSSVSYSGSSVIGRRSSDDLGMSQTGLAQRKTCGPTSYVIFMSDSKQR